MPDNNAFPQRRSPRLKDYDYSMAGAYFVTICVKHRRMLFGEVVEGRMCLNPLGEATRYIWENLPERFPDIELDLYVIMPNHFHGIIVINEAPTPNSVITPRKLTLGQIIRTFKALTSYYLHAAGFYEFSWQQKYWDSILRNDKQLEHVRQYIVNNPAKWALDTLNVGADLSRPSSTTIIEQMVMEDKRT